jgi:hypothetical protein
MRIYISIPITGRNNAEVHIQVDAIKHKLQKEGYTVVAPFDICPANSELKYHECMGKDIAELLKCDGIYMGAGWRKSRGCQAEYEIARIYNINIIKDEL